VSLSFPEVYLGLCALLLLLLPAGLVLLRLAERGLGRTLRLTWVERTIVAVYLAGGLLYVIASVPVPLFGTYLVLGVVVAGIAGAVVLRTVLRTPVVGPGTRVESTWELAALVGGTLALLLFELVPVWQHPLPNAWDGSVAALWVNLTLNNHTLPWTLEPYASAGVTYPQGQTIWLALPATLWGWSSVETPVLVPPLFLALGLPATYCWGRRLGGVATRSGQASGLLFAAFFAVVASWPRLYVGGSYDFVIALPLFLVMLGWVREAVSPPSRPWSEVLLLGAAVGVLASLSLPCGEAYMVLLVGFVLLVHGEHRGEVLAWVPRLALVALVAAAFLASSIAGSLIWFGYPSHVLAQTGASLQTPPPFWSSFGNRLLQQELNPFEPWKERLSPFPAVSLMLQVLLVLGLIFAGWVALRRPSPVARLFPPHFLSTLLATCAVLFLLTAALATSQASGPGFAFLGAVSNFDETSYLLFIGLSALALVPLAAAVFWLVLGDGHASSARASPQAPQAARGPTAMRPARGTRSARPDRARWLPIALVMGIVGPMTLGTVATAVSGPGFLERGVEDWSHVTAGDLTTLEWSSTHLPSCSAVYVAPGSVGQFLPEYAKVHLVYQMTPSPWNRSYYDVYADLSLGVYNASTRLGLTELGVTEVFVSGPTTPHFPPIDPAALENNSDFRELTQSGDASIFEFVSGNASLACAPQ
jgi:hypothetical protein